MNIVERFTNLTAEHKMLLVTAFLIMSYWAGKAMGAFIYHLGLSL